MKEACVADSAGGSGSGAVLAYLGGLHGGGLLWGISFPLCQLVHFCQHHVGDELPVLGLVIPHQGHGGAHHLHRAMAVRAETDGAARH